MCICKVNTLEIKFRLLALLCCFSTSISAQELNIFFATRIEKELDDDLSSFSKLRKSITRDICPAPKVSNEFRQHVETNIPVVIIQGDMDMSTPYENATFLMKYLKRGHLLTVKRGFHNAKRALIFEDPDLVKRIYEFMNIDFEKEDFQSFRNTLPSTYELPEFNFWSVKD